MILLLNFFQFILALVALRTELSSSACRDSFTHLMCTALSMPLKATDISNSILNRNADTDIYNWISAS